MLATVLSTRPRMAASAAGVLALLLAAPSFVCAQSLAELARQEEARRKATKGAAKVYTNKDLAGGESKTVASSGAATSTPPAAGQASSQPAPAPAQEPESPKKDEKYWRQRITEAQDKLAQSEIMLAALESRINALTTDFTNRDDPAQRAVISQDRQKAVVQMDRTKKDIERLKKEVADIQEEARKAGVPAGWLR